jgi:glyoxylate reductase
VSLDELLTGADFVSIHCPLTAETRNLIGARELSLMKPDAYLINTARGGIVDDVALIVALRDNRIFAAALDVYENEPQFDPGFLDLKNVVLVPHIGSASEPTRRAMANTAARNCVAALTGGVPPDLLNPDVVRR